MTKPSTRCVRTCRPSGHALGSQGPLSDWLSGSSSDRQGASGSASARRCDSPAAAFSAFSAPCGDGARSVRWAARAGRSGGGFSAGGVTKGEEGGDWEERLDNAEGEQRHMGGLSDGHSDQGTEALRGQE